MFDFISNNKEYIQDLITRSTYHSNSIEGSTLTYAETYAILYNDNSFKIQGKEPREIYEAINHKSALELVFDSLTDDVPFDERLVTSSPTYISNFFHKILDIEVGASFCDNMQTVGSRSIVLMD